ncbi:hypothetical protein HWN36_01260 [Methanofollis tationis]|uniref:Uncharacterized protein n=1 Tax=Methanofollis tationis TaxID=81417 RepID=A0A7K4HL27_9EURY|nr:hypothetical protein [Methanofollis tationis]
MEVLLVVAEGKNHGNALSMLISDRVLFYRAQFFLPPVGCVSYIIHLFLQGVVSRIEDPELDAPSRKTCEPSGNDLLGTLLHPLPVLTLHTHPEVWDCYPLTCAGQQGI